MRRFRDVEGDTWTEQSNGSYLLTEPGDQENRFIIGTQCTDMEDLAAAYGPLTELGPATGDLSAPATRGDLVRIFECLSAFCAEAGDERLSGLWIGLANEIKEERA